MVRQWNFYFSGILYGIFKETADGNNGLTFQFQNPLTGLLESEKPYTEEEEAFFTGLCKRSLLSFFSAEAEYEQHIRAGESEFTGADGKVFSRRVDGSYIQRALKFPMDLYQKDGSIYAVQMAGRDYTAVLVLNGREEETSLSQWPSYPLYPVLPAQTFRIPTRDGELLATDVYLPGKKAFPIPTVLIRTPYGKTDGYEQYYRFVQRGYAVVIQDTRGREDSTGEWLPNYYETEDGDDTLNWIAAQDFSNGDAAMTGGSYLGFVQWAAAASGSPHLKALLSSVCAGSPFIDLPRRGGCFTSGSMAWNFAMAQQQFRGDLMERDDWDTILNVRPIGDMPAQALGHSIPFVDKWMAHPDYDDFWHRSNWKERNPGHVVPALVMSGWFDDNGMGTTEALELIREYYPQGTWKAVLGPWKHSGNANYDIHGSFMGEHALRYDMDILCFAWLDHFLNGVENGVEKAPAVEYYTLGENRWKMAVNWPIPESTVVPWYLHGADHKTAAGNERSAGRGLTPDSPESSGADSYTYEPDHPATHIVDMSENELEVPENYKEEEKRSDILCYSTPILTEKLTVTGDITVVLYLSSDCPDTDLFVRITDVDEKGSSIKLADGMLDVKYRNSFSKPEFMEPGNVYEIQIRTTKISNTFQKGHQLRLTVTSSAKNFIFPNSNTEQGFDSPETRTAHHRIYWGHQYPSRVELRIEDTKS